MTSFAESSVDAAVDDAEHPLLADWRCWQIAARRAERTVSERIRVLRLFAAETRCSPVGATPSDVIDWLGMHSDWSDATAATYHSYLRSWFMWLCQMDHRADNPMLKLGALRYPDRLPRPITDGALVRLLEAPMRHRTRVMILLASLAGLRVHEIAKVCGDDVDLAGCRLYVDGKNRSRSALPLHPLLIDAAATMPIRDWWFPANSRRPGQHLRSKSVSQVIGDAMRRTRVNGTPHSLRHWYGTTLLDDGADLRTVQELLRHRSLATTAIYTKIPDGRRRDAVGRLDPCRAKTPPESSQ